MLNHIPAILSPELVKVMMTMGHGDELLLADANYPAHTMNTNVITLPGIGVPELLKAILTLMPLDAYSDAQAITQAVVPGDTNVHGVEPEIWTTYRQQLNQAFPDVHIASLERFAFYEHSRSCFAIVQTGETALYGNLIIKKGVVLDAGH